MVRKMDQKLHSLPTDLTVVYPESDGKPMAETDFHYEIMTDTIDTLKERYAEHHDVYVAGNLIVYYQEKQPKKFLAPDVFVVFGVEKKKRRTYRLWEEGKGPDFVLEVASQSTCDYDLGEKKDLYASRLGVQEYYLYDPDKRYLPSPLLGFRLIKGVYVPIQAVEGRLPSDTLGLELGEEGGRLRLYNPLTKKWVLKPAEQAKAEALRAQAQVRRARAQARQAKARAQQAEAELARLRAELERLRTPSAHP